MLAPSDNPLDPNDRMLRQFAGLWIVFFAAIAARMYFHGRPAWLWMSIGAAALTIGPMGLLWPRLIKPIFVGWMKLASPIGWVVSRVVLGLIFFGLITPLAWAFRRGGRDALGLKRSMSTQTYWQSKPAATDKAQYLRQF
jgi:saxitoxin biosynthesis operon SxtJ-like protein